MAENALYQPRIDGEMRATQPRNALLGLLADALYAADKYAQRPNPSMPMGKANPPLSLLSSALGLGDIAATADRYNMRQDLTRGTGWATQMLPETANALLSVGPAVAKYPKQAAVAAGLLSGGADPAAMKAVAMFDKRFDPRVKESVRLAQLEPVVEARPMAEARNLSLADLEGKPFITSMSDRTAAGGQLVGINDVRLNRPVNLRGGQDFMFDNPGQVWASAPGPVKQITNLAQDIKRVTGQNPLFIPWRMAPTGGDFAAMTGETMLNYAASNMAKRDLKALDKAVAQYIPNWSGAASDASIDQFRSAPDSVRKAIKQMMDVEFRDRGGLGIGEARLSVTDPKQLVGQDAGVMNVGQIFADSPTIMKSGHPSYPRGVPGEGIGRIAGQHNIFDLLPSVVQQRGMPSAAAPRATDIRALQMKPYAGIIDEALLRSLGY